MENLIQIASKINSIVWGAPLLILLVGTGAYLTLRLGCIQITKLPLAFKYMFAKEDEDSTGEGDVTSFQALCTALAATIGTGNIVGVATAVKAGGPGAIFWMWVAAFFGMATKYAESLLAVKYRVTDGNGQMSGGPMYYIERGLGSKLMAKMFAIFGIGVAFFGIGTFAQINAISDSLKDSYNVPVIVTGIIITLLVTMVTLGGINNIAKVSEKVVPFMAILYLLASLTIIGLNIKLVPEAIKLVFTSAFNPTAAIGGFLGATVKGAIQNGIARGVFSNESGLGSAPIAAAAAKTKSCVRQGLISMTGTFIDTIVICTMTGLTLVLTGAWKSELSGAAMTNFAFINGIRIPYVGKFIITVGLMFFAFTTILGWNYYGERCAEYLFGIKGVKPYRYIFILIVGIGGLSILKLDLIWIIADIVNGLMAIPNLIALVGLSGVVISETKKYFDRAKEIEEINENHVELRKSC
ncbi:sodium:alanine symporter family protein [Clostridium malenominatum]|uniref:Sodium:alanine symporter family protein n=1 Tax=Clostridium malenominatum TaxID=1539 RepID=A0ABN1J101_9CLOT